MTIFGGSVGTTILPNLINAEVFWVKLEPVTVTSVPVIPLAGFNITTGPRLTVNVADPLFPEASVAAIVWLPVLALLGITIVAENVPDAVADKGEGVVVSVVLSNFTVIALLELKLEPDIVTVALGWPALGESVTVAGIITLKEAEAVLAALSVAVTV